MALPLLLATTGALSVGSIATTSSVANADPPYNAQAQDFVGVGSNTIEDLYNAYSGEEPTPGIGVAPILYTPLDDPATGDRIYSFDAENAYDSNNTTNVGCIETKIGGTSFDRPNGSGNGFTALSDALTNTLWYQTGPPQGCHGTAATAQSVTGQIDFSRSSSAPSSSAIVTSPTDANCGAGVTDPCVSYIPFAHDGVTYAYYRGDGRSHQRD